LQVSANTTTNIQNHDRDFPDRVAKSVALSARGGAGLEHAGGYSDKIARRGFGLVLV
jgi:ATP-binding cassette subfamily F protein uup